jgi:DNA-binding PadR family transcriptional regulator
MQRQRGRRGYGRHEMRGGRGYGHGRHRVRRGDVRSAILALLDDRPMHGYEMIQELEERTGGRWTPSAGSIYPTLQLLEDEGLVTAEEVEGRKVYSLTDAGQEAAPERTEGGQPWEQGDEDSPRFQARRELFQLMGAAKQLGRAGDDAQLTKAAEILKDARRKLYGLLAEE